MSRFASRTPARPTIRARSRNALVVVGCLLTAAVAPLHLVLSAGFGHVHVDHGKAFFHQHGNLGAHRHADLERGAEGSSSDEDSGGSDSGSEARTIPLGAAPALPSVIALEALATPPPPTLRQGRPETPARRFVLARAPGEPRGPPLLAVPA